MNFKPGDRVRVISLKCEGVVETSDERVSTVLISDPELIKKLRPKEKIKTNPIPMDDTSMRYFTFTSDLLPALSKSEPDWKDIWDSNT